jgi:cytochrome c oxidase accessory protein FixG
MRAAHRTVIPIAAAADDAATQMVSLYQSEKKIYPRAVSGWFARWRWALVWATQILFYGLPWLRWNGRPAVLFDLAARRFYIFDLVLYPQDFIYLTVLLIVSAYSLFLFTAVAGRLWCGFACPQTVYTEVFMWIEQRIEGDRSARMKLDAAPWGPHKLLRKGGKQAAWLALGLWTGITFVGYFTPIRTLLGDAAALFDPAAGATGPGAWEWFWALFYGLATYGNAGYLREQVCKYMCPYARFQSAMFDKDTMVIAYDPKRGEPRGSRPRSLGHAALSAAGKGDCIDCTLCVQVCPTGIDIRKGLQYECIGCAACIDVCDGVMDKMQYPRGLIRYATQTGMQRGWSRAQMLRRVARPRVLVYSGVLLAIVVAFGASLMLRAPFRVDVVRDRAALARLVEDGHVENVYRLQLMNATELAQRYRIAVDGLPGARLASRDEVDVDATASRWVPASVRVDPQAANRLGPGAHTFSFRIERVDHASAVGAAAAPAGAVVREASTFVVPR